MGGTNHRMKELAKYLSSELNIKNEDLIDICQDAHRYAVYKARLINYKI